MFNKLRDPLLASQGNYTIIYAALQQISWFLLSFGKINFAACKLLNIFRFFN